MQLVQVVYPSLRAPRTPIASAKGRVLVRPVDWRSVEASEDALFQRLNMRTFRRLLDREQGRRKKRKVEPTLDAWILPLIDCHGKDLAAPTITGLIDLWIYRRGGLVQEIEPNGRFRLLSVTGAFADFLEAGIFLSSSKPRFTIALQRWSSSLSRSVSIDAIIDCCSCLDSLFNVQNELRLRLALAVGAYVPRRKVQVRKLVYDMYGRRNDFVHGSSIPSVTVAERRALTRLSADILETIVSRGALPKTQLPWAAL